MSWPLALRGYSYTDGEGDEDRTARTGLGTACAGTGGFAGDFRLRRRFGTGGVGFNGKCSCC
jgi:hypothetical protein